MPHRQLTTMETRTEWVKMFWPREKGIPVGVIHRYGGEQGLWVFDHRTDDTRDVPRYKSPMGLDTGTLIYLLALASPPELVHYVPKGSATVYEAPLAAFRTLPVVPCVTTAGQPRQRLFLPMAFWSLLPLYPETRPPWWQVTHIRMDGSVLGRFIPD